MILNIIHYSNIIYIYQTSNQILHISFRQNDDVSIKKDKEKRMDKLANDAQSATDRRDFKELFNRLKATLRK